MKEIFDYDMDDAVDAMEKEDIARKNEQWGQADHDAPICNLLGPECSGGDKYSCGYHTAGELCPMCDVIV